MRVSNLCFCKNQDEPDRIWHIIDAAHQQAEGDVQQQEALLIEQLASYSPANIIDFERILRRYILDADSFKLIAAQKIIQGHVTDDPYLYFRCWLIGQGSEVFFEALRNPDSLAELVVDEYEIDFEALLLVATEAFQQKTGLEEEDEGFPREIAFEEGLDYDGPTETKGENWTEEQLPMLLPKLWAKFG